MAAAQPSPATGSHAAAAVLAQSRTSWNRVVATGNVTSVDGVATTGHCGTAGKTGTFAVQNPRTTKTLTAHVTAATKFYEEGVQGATFADVCVGRTLSVAGNVASSTFSASRVVITAPPVDRVVATGKVTSVDGVTTTGHCGTAGKTGTFAVQNPRTTKTLTAHVTAATKFYEAGVAGASFADVCVGRDLSVAGTVASSTFSAARVVITAPPVRHEDAEGKVTSVDGVSTAGHCGTAGKTGTFAVQNPRTTKALTAHVTAATKFYEGGVAGPTFADVCVGRTVSVAGTVVSSTFTSTRVVVTGPPVRHESAAGKVTSVDGVTTAGHCGTAGKTGTFTVRNSRTTKSVTPHVTASTKFYESGVTGASFADVCVGRTVSVAGTVVASTFSATRVVVTGPPVRHESAAGKVTSVDGVTTTGHCGTAGKTGTFVVENQGTARSVTVHVTATTKFSDAAVAVATFGDVCVGRTVAVAGTVVSSTFTASSVVITVPPVHHESASGTVTSVDGVTTTGHCGTAGKTGTFTVENMTTAKSVTAHVTAATKFSDAAVAVATFVDVCVGRTVTVTGTVTSSIFSATSVDVTA